MVLSFVDVVKWGEDGRTVDGFIMAAHCGECTISEYSRMYRGARNSGCGRGGIEVCNGYEGSIVAPPLQAQ